MKILGIVFVWFGVVALLKNIGIIRVVDWSIVWPVLLIIYGLSFKHFKHSMICRFRGKCGLCDTSDSHKCDGAECGTCKE